MVRPDFREVTYQNELYHYGLPHRSGRYPWGSGDRPYQSREERKEARTQRRNEKNLKIGSERLQNRIKRANELSDVDNLSKKIGWKNTEKAADAHRGIKNIKEVSNEILADEGRTKTLGDYTRKARIADIAVTSSAISAVSGLGSAALIGALELPVATLAIPIGASIGIGKLGYDFYQKTKY